MDNEKRFRKALEEGSESMGITLQQRDIHRFTQYADLVLAANTSTNLTRIEDEDEFAIKHLVDSMVCMKAGVDLKGRGVDVGSGAGFPGVVLAILNHELSIVLLDARRKRIEFLQEVCRSLDLGHVRVVHARAEEFGQSAVERESYDWVVARAVAPLAVLGEYCLPLLKRGGCFLAMKGDDVEGEVEEAAAAMTLLGGSLERQTKFILPRELGRRSIVVYNKCTVTPPKYPRKAGMPAKRPL